MCFAVDFNNTFKNKIKFIYERGNWTKEKKKNCIEMKINNEKLNYAHIIHSFVFCLASTLVRLFAWETQNNAIH